MVGNAVSKWNIKSCSWRLAAVSRSNFMHLCWMCQGLWYQAWCYHCGMRRRCVDLRKFWHICSFLWQSAMTLKLLLSTISHALCCLLWVWDASSALAGFNERWIRTLCWLAAFLWLVEGPDGLTNFLLPCVYRCTLFYLGILIYYYSPRTAID